MSREKVQLGRYLFYDQRLSVNGTQSCAGCHRQELAFTDGRTTSSGATGQTHLRSAMSLVNVAYAAALTWSNPALRSLEEQALVPMFSEHPVELRLRGRESAVLALLRSEPLYRDLLPRAFPGTKDPFLLGNVQRAMAAFERSIISARSPYYTAGGRAHENPNRDSCIRKIDLTPRNRADLLTFLQTLTDQELLHDERFSNPWPNAVSSQN